MNLARRLLYSFVCLLTFLPIQDVAADIRFRVTLPAGSQQPVTGRVFIIISKIDDPEPRLQVGSWRSRTQMLARDVQFMQPGQSAMLDALTLGFPSRSVRELPAGDYY